MCHVALALHLQSEVGFPIVGGQSMSAGITVEVAVAEVAAQEAVAPSIRTRSVRQVLALSIVGLGLALNLAWIGAILWVPVQTLIH